ncbi:MULTISPECIES: GTP-binding protein [unclassified Roseovarius]|uniref:GTP-binding protein n=1 Tax=unclassified Roseovarius TaxID=2614913 RepID=UPI00273E1AFA|nr:GTP-binding protein [Roseovarius sp. MMSF_3350]
MNTAEQLDPVIDRLGRVLDRGNLPPPYARCGARLLSLLTRPVQVVVTGFAGSGKTKLLEMMSAHPDVAHAQTVPIFELSYGDTEQALIERADGSVSMVRGFLKHCEIPKDAVRVRQELPDPNLIQQDYIEIGLGSTEPERLSALEAVIARADLVIWCSQDFTEEEQRLWSTVPDHIKDHSVLALTKADQLLMRDMLNDNIARLEPIVSDEFLGLFPVATIQGVTAQTGAEHVNDPLWAASGGKSLMQLVSRHIRQGRTADIDQARVFLDRLALKMPQDAEQPSEIPNAPPKPVGAPETHTARAPQNETPPDGGARDEATIGLLSEAVDVLQRHADQMFDALNESEDVDSKKIIDCCSDAIRSVGNLLGSGTGNAATDALQGDLQDGEEMLMLFQLERGEEAAVDAVALVLQLRKELTGKMAGRG